MELVKEETTVQDTLSPEQLAYTETLMHEMDKAKVITLDDIQKILNALATVHQTMYNDHKVVCEKLGYAYHAVNDAKEFLIQAISGQEVFSDIPEPVKLKEEDTQVVDGCTLMPDAIEDQKYMREWFKSFFFPELHKVATPREDYVLAVSVLKATDESEELQVNFLAENTKDQDIKVDVLLHVKAGDSIDIKEIAKVYASIE